MENFIELKKDEQEVNLMPPLTWAYVGDCVYELYIRTKLVNETKLKPHALHIEAIKHVKAKAQAETLNKIYEELTEKEKQLEEDYRHKREQMEPELVDVLVDVFDKVTHTIAEDKKDMILTLVDSVMSQVELSHNFLIRVSKDDYQFLVDNKERITALASASGNSANIDIFEDVTLKRNECIIETDVGIFDCSLDIQLENLIKDIKLLSCV